MASSIRANELDATSVPLTRTALPTALTRILVRPLASGSEAHLDAFSRRSNADQSLYISTPITTGPRLLAWHRANPGAKAGDTAGKDLRQDVIAENIRALVPLRSRIARECPGENVIDPTELDEPGWLQDDYHRFWLETITRFASRIVFADGWQYSTGCSLEFAMAVVEGLDLLDSSLQKMSFGHALDLLVRAKKELDLAGLPSVGAMAAMQAIDERGGFEARPHPERGEGLKDDVLAGLAESHNVALFASFSPGEPTLRHRFTRSSGGLPNDLDSVVSVLLAESHEGALNVRSFRAGESKSSPFIYGLETVPDVVREVRRLAEDGYYTIVNETIDVHDGGVSGVRLGDIVEFAPDTTPRGVEGMEVARLPISVANELLTAVYGFPVDLPGGSNERIEFSIHPDAVGHRYSHICVWELEAIGHYDMAAEVSWPNDFSRLIGDKVFGLLIAHLVGAPVPFATAVPRRVAPFSFGKRTGSGEWWIRTAPRKQEPGKYSTHRGWRDPFVMLGAEDPGSGNIAAVLSQEGVVAQYSGATAPTSSGVDIIEGVRGSGDRFMLGEQGKETLPVEVDEAVRKMLSILSTTLGPVRTEWAFDGVDAWVVQLHKVGDSSATVLNPGEAESWVEFDPASGLEALRSLAGEIAGSGTGVIVTGRVGVTSHVGDILRKSGIAARFVGSVEN